MGYKAILGTVPTFQALGLLGSSARFAKKGKGAVKTAITSFIGIPLIGKTASLIKGL